MANSKKNTVVNLITVLVSLLAVLYVVELLMGVDAVTRYFGLPKAGNWEWQVQGRHRPDRELIYTLVPDFSAPLEEADPAVRVTTNSLGLRGREVRTDVRGNKRILVLGDSMVFGWGAGDEDTFPAQLETALNTPQAHYEVINAGVQGYGTDQSYRSFMRRLNHLKPDLVIFCLFENDGIDNIRMPLYTIENDHLSPLDVSNHPVYITGQLQKYIPASLKRTNTYGVFSTALARRIPYELLPDRDMQVLDTWAKRKMLLQARELNTVARRDGFQLLVVGLPYKIGKYNDAHLYSFMEQAERYGVDFLDLSVLPVWQEQEATLFMQGRDPHTSLAGYRLIAELLSKHIREHGSRYFGST